jgi:hypothetical protein
MRLPTPVALGAYAGGLAVAFLAAFAVGDRVAPLTASTTTENDSSGHAHSDGAAPLPGTPARLSDAAGLPGLAVSAAGYTLVPQRTWLSAGPAVRFQFTVTGPDGRPVTSYTESHERDLHLVMVRRDYGHFQHVHPRMASDGRWSVALDLSAGGIYRVFADFRPAALESSLTLGTDVHVKGTYVPLALPQPAAEARVDGYGVTLDGSPVAGREVELTFTVAEGGQPVTHLQPYLGAFGHLVSLREGDLAYLHTHPTQGGPAAGHGASAGGHGAHGDGHGGPDVRFTTEFPTAGRYRLFLEFRVHGVVRTAEFTVAVAP